MKLSGGQLAGGNSSSEKAEMGNYYVFGLVCLG